MDWAQIVAGVTTLLSGVGGAIAKNYSDTAATWKRLWEEERADNIRKDERIDKFYEEGRLIGEQRAAESRELRRELDEAKAQVLAARGGRDVVVD